MTNPYQEGGLYEQGFDDGRLYERNRPHGGHLWVDQAELARLRVQVAALIAAMRSIELDVDGLNTRSYAQKPNTQAALDRIKTKAREILAKHGGG